MSFMTSIIPATFLLKQEEKKHELSVKLSVAMTRIRKRSLCNVRFIGEFFKLKMLSESIMKECISRLLRSTSDEKALECFGMLIMITGKELDKPEVKVGCVRARLIPSSPGLPLSP